MYFFVKRILLLLIVGYTCQLLVFICFKQILDRNSKFRLTRFFANPTHSFFVVGNSRAAYSVNEKFAIDDLHKDVINIGFNGMSYNSILAFLDDINKKNRNATIFIEISCLPNEFDDVTYSYYMSNSDNLKKLIRPAKFDILPLLRLNNDFFLKNIYYLNKSDNEWIANSVISEALKNQVRNDTTAISLYPDIPKLVRKIRYINQTCNSHQNRVVFFIAPYYPEYLRRIKDYNMISEILYRLGKEVMFCDLNLLKLPEDGYADRVHTNIKASKILTVELFRFADSSLLAVQGRVNRMMVNTTK